MKIKQLKEYIWMFTCINIVNYETMELLARKKDKYDIKEFDDYEIMYIAAEDEDSIQINIIKED